VGYYANVKGFFNRLLRVDLERRSFRYEEIPDTVLASTLGGKGLGAHLLWEENPPGVDPLAAEARFVVAVGPVTGTKLWSQSRYAVFAKSPATGGFCESYCGGSLAPKIKGCGIDALVLEGRASGPTALLVDEQGVRFLDVASLWGQDTAQATAGLLASAPKDAGAMVIGPAGEARAAMACIKSDRWRSCGRGGMGAVLGSKQIKGVVFVGSRAVRAELADAAGLQELVRAASNKGKDIPSTEAYQTLGTPMMVALNAKFSSFPTRYWQKGYFDKWQNISADSMRSRFQIKSSPCPTCFLRCTKHSRVLEGRHAGLELEGPEYETIYAMGGLNEVDSLEEIAWLNDICDRLGLDTMSAGNLSGFAIEAFRRGKTDFPIDYNQPDRMAELFGMIASRRGLGDLLARGIREASAELGLEDLAVHVKGLEPAGYDPRALKGMGLSYAVSPRGACHLRSTFYKAEFSGQIDKDQIEGKARLVVDYEDRLALFDCLILCRFYRDILQWEELSRIIQTTTGMSLSKEELENWANALIQKTRAYNLREGLGPEADTLPPRIFREPTAEGATIRPEQLQVMLREYNSIRREREAPVRPGGARAAAR
jgi:aldehyde:ferredoxin oxidoreductase